MEWMDVRWRDGLANPRGVWDYCLSTRPTHPKGNAMDNAEVVALTASLYAQALQSHGIATLTNQVGNERTVAFYANRSQNIDVFELAHSFAERAFITLKIEQDHVAESVTFGPRGERETVRCEAHRGAHFLANDCLHAHFTDGNTRRLMNSAEA